MSGGGHKDGDDMLGGLVQKLVMAIEENFAKINPKDVKITEVVEFLKTFMKKQKVEETTIKMVIDKVS